MPITSVIKYEGDNDTLVWKHPSEDFNTQSQLIVHQSQEAILFKNGRAMDMFGPGRYVLKVENIPILRKFINMPSGGVTPYHCEVYFINKVDVMNIKWGTRTPLQITDPKYNVILPVGANGQFALKVVNSRIFLTRIVGTAKSMDKIGLIEAFRGILMKNIKEYLSRQFLSRKISFLEVNNYLSEMSSELMTLLQYDFGEYGLTLQNFNIITLFVPESDPSYKKIKDALAKKAEMNIVGYTYSEGRTFDVYEKAAENEGNIAAPLINAGVGLGVAAKASQVLTPAGSDDDMFEEVGVRCPKCNNPLPKGAAFCPKCGNRLAKTCPKCGHAVESDMIFCPWCGGKINE